MTQTPCTQNHSFTPEWARGNMTTPDCNGGIGCVACWEVYERAHDKWEREHSCGF